MNVPQDRVSVHVDTRGAGPDLVLVHGWGLHGGVWDTVAARLAERCRLHIVDLPGFGASPLPEGPYTLEALAAAVAEAVPAGADWLGWSLGGMVALAAVGDGADLRRLVTVGTSPRFVAGPDWPHAVDPAVLDGFAAELEDDFEGTLQRFLALQTRGAEDGRATLRRLREALTARGAPRAEALAGGLAILREADLRPALPALGRPVLLVQGERDTLVPTAAAEAAADLLPDARLQILAGAGHAPFLSHPEAFVAAV
ncbi:MAG TPA: pimeloyl-ACP methyl ester esterase BioH, partial [Gammaproteobacteria bacterium]|nr:pimeloyl-ACP methyl ester esterase BioH [Gammaproteobacteria bacterium]